MLYSCLINITKIVSAINAKTVQIQFNKPVDASSVIDDQGTTDTSDDTLNTGSIVFTAIDGQVNSLTQGSIKATLSDYRKTLTLIAANSDYFNKRYTVAVNGALDTNGDALPEFTSSFDATDSTRPTIRFTSFSDNGLTFNVKFSEPVASVGTVKLYDGSTPIAVSPSFNDGDDTMSINLTDSDALF
jgi:trimeric autotransporter adhesin